MKPRYVTARILLSVSWGAVCVLSAAAPWLLARGLPGAAPLYLGFSFFCHQIPERSFTLAGIPLAVCHRCTGIYLGLFLGPLVSTRRWPELRPARRWWLLWAVAPAFIDFALGSAGLWPGAAWSRLATGIFLGYMISPLLVRALAEFPGARSPGNPALGSAAVKGDFS